MDARTTRRLHTSLVMPTFFSGPASPVKPQRAGVADALKPDYVRQFFGRSVVYPAHAFARLSSPAVSPGSFVGSAFAVPGRVVGLALFPVVLAGVNSLEPGHHSAQRSGGEQPHRLPI